MKLAMSFVMDVIDNAKLYFLTRVHATDANRTPQSANDFTRPETLTMRMMRTMLGLAFYIVYIDTFTLCADFAEDTWHSINVYWMAL